MAWGSNIVTVVQFSSAQWGVRRKIVDTVWQREYIVNERTAEWGHSETSANTRRDTLMATPETYQDVQVQRTGSSNQYWVIYVTVTKTWVVDPFV